MLEIMEKTEKQKRETSRQNLIIGMQMAGNQIYSAFQNPKNFFKALYYGSCGYVTYQALKLVTLGFSRSIMGRFGKPQLVRETSKLHTNNYALIPFL